MVDFVRFIPGPRSKVGEKVLVVFCFLEQKLRSFRL